MARGVIGLLAFGLWLGVGPAAAEPQVEQAQPPASMLALAPVPAQPSAQAPAPNQASADLPSSELSLSPECRAPGSKLYTLAPLRRIKVALKAGKPIKVFAFGSSSTVGVGASSALQSYPVRLETELEKLFRGVDFEVVNFGVSGEVASATAERIRIAVADTKPDLLIWQVGTNDALAKLSVESFGETLRSTLQWLKDNKVDTVLLDPQYTSDLAKSERYGTFVQAVETVARTNRLPLVRRYEAMAHLAQTHAGADRIYLSGDHFHLNDLGYRCMAEQVARAITLCLAQAE